MKLEVCHPDNSTYRSCYIHFYRTCSRSTKTLHVWRTIFYSVHVCCLRWVFVFLLPTNVTASEFPRGHGCSKCFKSWIYGLFFSLSLHRDLSHALVPLKFQLLSLLKLPPGWVELLFLIERCPQRRHALHCILFAFLGWQWRGMSIRASSQSAIKQECNQALSVGTWQQLR